MDDSGSVELTDELDVLCGTAALGVLDLVFSTPEWVHRRVEKVELSTPTHFKRAVSLDFTLPVGAATSVEWFDGESVNLVVLDVLAKRPVQGFSSFDVNGQPLPILTRRQNGAVSTAGLIEYGHEVLRAAGLPELTVEQRSLIETVVTCSPVEARAALSELLIGDTEASCALEHDVGFVQLAAMLASSFLLIGMSVATPGRRSVIKLEYEESMVPGGDKRTRWGRFSEALGLRSTSCEIPAHSFMDCESFHFEVVAPDGVELVDIVLGDEHPSRRENGTVPNQWSLGFQELASTSPHRGHLSTSRTSDPEGHQDEFLDPRVSVGLQLDRNGWIFSSLASAFVTLVMLLTFGPLISEIARGLDPVPGPIALTAGPTQDAAATLSLAVLSLASFAAVRPGQHPFAVQLVRPLRVVAATVALVPLAAATLIVAATTGWVLISGWCVLALVDIVGFLVLWAAWRS